LWGTTQDPTYVAKTLHKKTFDTPEEVAKHWANEARFFIAEPLEDI